MTKHRFNVIEWKKQIFRELLHPGGCIPQYKQKPPAFYYASADGDIEAEAEIELDAE